MDPVTCAGHHRPQVKTKRMVSNQMRSHHKSTNYVFVSVLLFCICATIPNSEGTVNSLEQLIALV